jgi:hypothetical protein
MICAQPRCYILPTTDRSYSAIRSFMLKSRYHVALRSLAVATARDPPMFGGCLGTDARNVAA